MTRVARLAPIAWPAPPQGYGPWDEPVALGPTLSSRTGGLVRHATNCQAAVDLVGTEVGMLHRLRQANPTADSVPVRDDAVCSYMKPITLPKLYRALRDLVYEVRDPEAVATRVRASIEQMLAIV